MIYFILPVTFLPVSPPEHDRHAEHAGGSVREWSGVSFSPDQEKERRQGGQCVVIPDPLSLFCSALRLLSTAGFFVPVCIRHRSLGGSAGRRPRSAPLSSFISLAALCRRGHIVCPLFIFCICPDEDNLDDHFFHFLSLTCPLKSSPGDSFKDKNQLFDFILGNSLSQRTGEQAGPAYVRPSHQHSQENLSFVMSQETFAAGSFLALRPFSL